MKLIFKIITTMILFSISTYAFNYNSTWINEDPNNRGITKLVVNSNGTIRAFGACNSRDCEWGTTSYTRTSNGLLSSWKQRGFGHKVILLESLRGDRAKATIKYLYNSRRDITKVVYFKRSIRKPDRFRHFVGDWVNEDRLTRGLTRLHIGKSGHRIVVRAWASCRPRDCDWGRFDAIKTGQKLRVKWRENGIRREMILSGVDRDRSGRFQTLKVKFTTFYNNERGNRSRVYYFYKQR
ncbi:hypothetical protein MNB_SV-6-94 [hydrothermal vent metagenome]|uniref:Uncharacterized protein n=1 Tax=hydrothermal vent metagenome TaxID=652676 RepID=A0A1W1BKE8_9ZZZZ